MIEPAMIRIPTEIWREIFRYALATDYLVSNIRDENQFQLLLYREPNITWGGCLAARSCLKSEKIRNNLRLVCNSWNEQLATTGADLAPGRHFLMTDLQTLDWPENRTVPLDEIHRLDLISWRLCKCLNADCPVNHSKIAQGSRRSDQPFELPSTYNALPKLDLLVLGSASLGSHYSDILLKATALKSLRIIGEDVFRTTISDPILTKDPLTRLTYLSLANLAKHQLEQFVLDAFLPKLEQLSLAFQGDPLLTQPQPPPQIINTSNKEWWSGSTLSHRLPKVSTLSFSGFTNVEFQRALNLFKSQLASTLVEVSVKDLRRSYFTSSGNIPLELHIRDSLPNMRLYSVPFGSMAHRQDTKPPNSDAGQHDTPLALLVNYFRVNWSIEESKILSLAEQCIASCQALRCDRIFLAVTWEEYNESCRFHLGKANGPVDKEEEWRRRNCAGLYIGYLLAHGVGVYDRRQVPYEVNEDIRSRIVEKILDSSLIERLDHWISTHNKSQEVGNPASGWTML